MKPTSPERGAPCQLAYGRSATSGNSTIIKASARTGMMSSGLTTMNLSPTSPSNAQRLVGVSGSFQVQKPTDVLEQLLARAPACRGPPSCQQLLGVRRELRPASGFLQRRNFNHQTAALRQDGGLALARLQVDGSFLGRRLSASRHCGRSRAKLHNFADAIDVPCNRSRNNGAACCKFSVTICPRSGAARMSVSGALPGENAGYVFP